MKNAQEKNALLIFSKYPRAGEVKTRMRPHLTEEQCLSLHLALLKDSILRARASRTRYIYLYLTENLPLPFSTEIPIRAQKGKDLGDRMLAAFRMNLSNHKKVVVIGTDSPTLKGKDIDEAFNGLDRHEIVIGPSEDGGYYLLGMRKLIVEVFRNIPWGTSSVLKKTLEVLGNRKLKLLPSNFDVDEVSDLHRLEEELKRKRRSLSPFVRAWFSEFRSQST
jgi:uncharacterized protein